MAEKIGASFQHINDELTIYQEGISITLEAEIPELNHKLAQIADLNVKITAAESTGITANGLRDERDLLLMEVSETVGVNYYENKNGTISMQLLNGQPLVEADSASVIAAERIQGKTQLSLTTDNAMVRLGNRDVGGKLRGLLEVRDGYIPELRDKLDRLAYEFATTVNGVHRKGVDLNRNVGGDLMSFQASIAPDADPWTEAAASLAVAFTDTALVAAGKKGGTADNANTLDMVALQETPTIDGTTTFTEFYSSIVTEVGVTVRENTRKLNTAEDSLLQLETRMESVSGVSTEEEMLTLLEYQTNFEAASKYIAVCQQMMDTLLDM